LLRLGRPDAAAHRFCCGQVRARFDANRCTDRTVGSAVAVLNERFGPPITDHVSADLRLLRRIVIRAVAWDRAAPPAEIEERWCSSHVRRRGERASP
jgi:hypothetical protein